jgi:outer membrane biosynthesis protein TonB
MCLTNYIKRLIVSLTILTLTTLVSVNSLAETATSGNLLPNAGDGVNTNAQHPNSTIDGIDSATGFTLNGITDYSSNYNELEAQGTGTVSASGSLVNITTTKETGGSFTTTTDSLDGGVNLTSITEVQNCEWSGSSYQCGQATPGRDSYSTTVKILDENDNVLAITTMNRNNDSGYRSNTFTYTDTITYTDTGSRKWDWQWQGVDGNSPNSTSPVGPNLLGASLTATLLNIDYSPISEETEEQLEDTNELLELAQEDLETLLENLEEVNLEQLEELQFETPILQELEIEEIKLEELAVAFEETFKEILIEENLIEEFETALIEENITEEEFFEEATNIIEEEFEELMPSGTTMKIEEGKIEMEVKEEEIVNEEEIATEENPQEEVNEEEIKEEVKEETTETESNANTETNTKTEDTSEESMESEQEGEPTNEESTMDENKETEGSETETNNEEAVDDKATGDDRQENDKIDSVNVKVKRIIAKLEKTLKDVNDQVKAVQFVTLKGIQAQGANLDTYNFQLKDKIKLDDGNPDFFNQLNIQQEQIYKNKSLNAYTNNDPISIKQTELQRIDMEKKQLLLELKILREG